MSHLRRASRLLQWRRFNSFSYVDFHVEGAFRTSIAPSQMQCDRGQVN